MGSALVAALLGTAAAVVVISTVLIVQCFLFADGGVTALGASIFNMAIVGGITGYAVYRALCSCMPGARGRVTAVAFAGWCSTVLAAICCTGELGWSGTVNWSVAFPAMAGIHVLIGLGEGLISALVLLAVERSRPDMIYNASGNGQGQAVGGFLLYGLLAAAGIAVFVAPFACPWPDGLEFVAQTLGFEHKAAEPMAAPVPDYEMPGVGWSAGATAAAGLTGVVAVFAMAWILGRVLVRDNAARSGNLAAK
ncbi:MAG TPA: energy-coupling factor ABC transporter permease, partial [Verrucomicrobiota bacterium]|nr:energy-coupling factor ABC transporter permease [Verrucomicrobiota bacterium]